MSERIPPTNVPEMPSGPLASFDDRARKAREQIDAEREEMNALLQNLQEGGMKELDLSDPEGDAYDETFRGPSTYR